MFNTDLTEYTTSDIHNKQFESIVKFHMEMYGHVWFKCKKENGKILYTVSVPEEFWLD